MRPEVALPKLKHVFFCMERWSHAQDVGGQDLTYRAVYSIVVAVLQYLLPLLIVLFIYFLIYKFLKEQQYPRHLRQNKTNTLLASISITHCLIWLPFSLFNILADLWPGTVSCPRCIHISSHHIRRDLKQTKSYCIGREATQFSQKLLSPYSCGCN